MKRKVSAKSWAAYPNCSLDTSVSYQETETRNQCHSLVNHFQKAAKNNHLQAVTSTGEKWRVPHEREINVTEEAT